MIALIAAVDEAGGIGLNAGLPWPRIPEDMQRFKDMTMGMPIVMGRKTFDSIGPDLKGREYFVLTNDPITFWSDPRSIGIEAFYNVSDLMSYLKPRSFFVIGGASIYDQMLPHASVLFITRVVGTFPADTFWKPDLSKWRITETIPVMRDDKLVCTFETYVKYLN